MSDRKYRQRGYQDDGERPPRSRSGPRPSRPEGPRGRGLGKPQKSVFRCADCGQEGADQGDIVIGLECACGAALHACVNCSHFDTAARFECRAEIGEPVRRKRAANDCEHFRPKLVVEFAREPERKPDDARSAFDALFDF
ncbi:MAG: hypothetical protein AAF604_09155 [Acidobacteriota bacterium]